MANEYMECDTLELAQEYCTTIEAEMWGGSGVPYKNSVTKNYATPQETLTEKFVVPKHYKAEIHSKAEANLGRREKPFDKDWFPVDIVGE